MLREMGRRKAKIKTKRNLHFPKLATWTSELEKSGLVMRTRSARRRSRSGGDLACPGCGADFLLQADLARHSWSHVEAGFACARCHEGFRTRLHLARHPCVVVPGTPAEEPKSSPARDFGLHLAKFHPGMAADGKGPASDSPSSFGHFPCSYCGRKYTTNSSRKRHTLIHRGERPVRCCLCPYQSFDDRRMGRHFLKRHSGEAPVYVVFRAGRVKLVNAGTGYGSPKAV